jgi:hypothetical protein
VGTGRLTLSGNTDVGGDAEIFGGVLQVDGSFGSVNTFVHQGSTLAASGSVQTGIVQVGSGGKVRPGSADAPGVLTVSGNYAQDDLATLAIQIAGADEFSKLDVSGNAFLSGTLEPVLLNDFIPAVGDTFAFLFYHDHDGEFSTIANENFFGNLHWVVDYDTDPTMAILTVVSGPAPIPDHGSTFLFLTLGLLGLVTYRRQLLRRQT